MDIVRRQWLATACSVGAGVVLLGCSVPQAGKDEGDEDNDTTKLASTEVTAAEDLMREHGVLRRALLVYQETAVKLRATPAAIAPDALRRTAKLFRAFGEEYHEQQLEEQFIFPAVQKAGLAAAYTGVLIAQHQRGRELTDYILSVTANPKIPSGSVEPLAKVMESLVRMYQHHAAIEDTVIFPAWKQTMNLEQMDLMNDKFEEIEHQQFGKDGYEDAVKQISDIEASLGLADLGFFTAPQPPETKEAKEAKEPKETKDVKATPEAKAATPSPANPESQKNQNR
jgi:hemerythrin-like domain-containing protein